MAAAVEPHPLEVRDLRTMGTPALETLLDEEIRSWRRLLDWDFRPSADLVRRFVSMRALTGAALVCGGNAVGYAYYVIEEKKGLIGDLYIQDEFRTSVSEALLLDRILKPLMTAPNVHRVESQLMMLSSRPPSGFPEPALLRVFSRNFMVFETKELGVLPPSKARDSINLECWTDAAQETAARLIAASYAGHVDGEINDQYRSVSGARRFLQNIVQYPGCGNFNSPASFLALHRPSGEVCGICLASLVSGDVGHITQICVTPEFKGRGVGYALLRRSLLALSQQGCRRVTLTVTAANDEAGQLYDRVGFRVARQFSACVWEGFRHPRTLGFA